MFLLLSYYSLILQYCFCLYFILSTLSFCFYSSVDSPNTSFIDSSFSLSIFAFFVVLQVYNLFHLIRLHLSALL
eukprot:UN17359